LWANVVFGDSFDSYYFGKIAYGRPQFVYFAKSPFFKMDKVKAPVADFSTAQADTNVSERRKSWVVFPRPCNTTENVPVKFVIFPGEPHGPRKLTHQMRKVEEEDGMVRQIFLQDPHLWQMKR